jgi:hypothetical protein
MNEEETAEFQRLHAGFLSNVPLSPNDQSRYEALLARIDAIDERVNARIFRSLQDRMARIEALEAENRNLRADCELLMSRLFRQSQAA